MKFTNEVKKGILFLTMKGDLIGEENGLSIVEIVKDSIDKGVFFSIIDISGLRYINSSGIGVLITILTKFRNKGGDVFLLKPSESVKKLLIITKLNAIFTIVETNEEALSKINELKS
ncbi:MAG: STAS domain-containing protein [Cyclobacteriaceae bacterium]|nr:STAS domain-containing protein [Cyclobacteriaceae bacterium]